jgi:hypothetical protein
MAALTVFSLNSWADDYSCQAKANPAVGLGFEFQVGATPADVGGALTMSAGGVVQSLGIISGVSELDSSDPNELNAFEMTVGMFSDEAVSGIKEADLASITSITVFSIDNTQGLEVYLYKFFAGTKQIGGTIVVSMMGTACLPTIAI